MPFVAEARHIDELGHVNNAVWVQWIQDVAGAHWYSAVSAEDQAAHVWVVVRHEIDYLRALLPGGSVTATTWADPDSVAGAKFDRMMEFVGDDGRVHVRARTTWALLHRATGRPLRVTAAVIAPFVEASRGDA